MWWKVWVWKTECRRNPSTAWRFVQMHLYKKEVFWNCIFTFLPVRQQQDRPCWIRITSWLQIAQYNFFLQSSNVKPVQAQWIQSFSPTNSPLLLHSSGWVWHKLNTKLIFCPLKGGIIPVFRNTQIDYEIINPCSSSHKEIYFLQHAAAAVLYFSEPRTVMFDT